MDRQLEKKKWPPLRIARWGGSGMFAIVVTYLVLSNTASTLNVQGERLTIFSVKDGPFQEFIPIIGTVQPIKTVYLDPVEGGRVEKLFLEAGAMVKEGDPILLLSNTALLLDIMYREAELYQQSNNLRTTRLALEQNRLALTRDQEQADYEFERAQRRFQRQKELHEKGIISTQDFEDSQKEYEYMSRRRELAVESREQDLRFRETQVLELEQSLRRMEANLAVAKQKLENLTIRAPVTGQLTSLKAEVGQSMSPGERLGQIDILDGFKVRAPIDEHYIDRVEVGKVGDFELSGQTYRLVVKVVFPEVREGRFEVDMEFSGTEPEGIRRGQSLHIRLALSDTTRAILLQRGGFYQKTGGNWVYVLDSDKEAVKRGIRLGRQNSDFFEVLEGLKPGDRVITSSYDSFGDMERLVIQ
ncbi:MAG: efflux RND transporter periplasmic adaptor subunit [Acidobacteriota bacterium]